MPGRHWTEDAAPLIRRHATAAKAIPTAGVCEPILFE